MFKSFVTLISLSLMAAALTACQPRLRSMGAIVEPAPMIHRVSADDKDSHMQVDAQGFFSQSDEAENVNNIDALGGTASFTYRFGGGASFLFFNASLAGYYGKLNFACTDEDCDDPDDSYYKSYKDWLETKDGQDRYDFVNLQERLVVGFDFNFGSYFMMGVSVGAQVFQGDGSYDEQRMSLASDSVDVDGIVRSSIIRNVEDKFGFGVISSAWIGTRFGEQGQYGNLSLEMSVFFNGGMSMWTNSWKVTYAHPTGFYAGYAYSSILTNTIYVGKSFVF